MIKASGVVFCGEKYNSVEAVNAPYLNLWNDEPKVNYNHVDNANPKFGSLSAGSLSRMFKIAQPAACHFTYFLQAFLKNKIRFCTYRFIIVRKSYKYLKEVKLGAYGM